MERRFKDFTDGEVYILKRMAMDSSWDFLNAGRYTDEQIQIHNDLLNEIISEDTIREYGEGK